MDNFSKLSTGYAQGMHRLPTGYAQLVHRVMHISTARSRFAAAKTDTSTGYPQAIHSLSPLSTGCSCRMCITMLVHNSCAYHCIVIHTLCTAYALDRVVELAVTHMIADVPRGTRELST